MENVNKALVEWMLWYYDPECVDSYPAPEKTLSDAEMIEFRFRKEQIKKIVGRLR